MIGAPVLDLSSNNYNTLRYVTAAAALADADVITFGLAGDAGATIAVPVAWAGNGTGVPTATGQTELLTDAQRIARLMALVNYVVNPATGAATPAASFWTKTFTAAPWRLNWTYTGGATAAGTSLEFLLHWLWTPIR